MKDEPLDLEARRRVYQAIARHPGIHLRELERRTSLALGDLRYHLDYLEARQLINSLTDGYRKAYFPTQGVFLQDRRTLSLLRQRVPRQIVLLLLRKETVDYEGLAATLGLSKPTLSFHLKKLVESGLITGERVEGRNVYRLGERERTLKLLLAYRESILDAAVDKFTEVWLPYLEP
jgi:predicted transcriptional regulator